MGLPLPSHWEKYSAWHSDYVWILGTGSDRCLGQVSRSVALMLSDYFVTLIPGPPVRFICCTCGIP